jgi:hypothetical protein
MYSWLFFNINSYFLKKKNSDYFWDSIAFVFFAQIIHFLLLISILDNLIFNDEIIVSVRESPFNNKVFYFIILGIWIFFTFKYFKNKCLKISIEQLIDVTLKKILIIFIFVHLIPLLFLIIISRN